ncbi:MAG: S8 family serine peptidase [Candidatus Limnocylindrales bacterium]
MDRSTQQRNRRPAGVWLLAMAVAFAALVVPASIAGASTAAALPLGLSQITAVSGNDATVRGIATFSAIPTRSQANALASLGLAVQRMKNVPLAIVQGKVSALKQAVANGTVNDVYPNDPLQLFDTASSDAMGSAPLRATGFTGTGVTVAVVDSGCDATHADLADHVVHNVKLYSPEYANINPGTGTKIVVPVEMLPYNNSDVGGGHGTHVAGIVAADSSSVTDGSRFGVAPDASLICYSIGEVLFTTAVVTAYDHMLDQPDVWGIDVVNNSWGNSFRQFDPRDPVAVVTKAIVSHGVVVVFAAGNSGDGRVEMGLNPFSQAPWVISVAAGTIDHQRGSFSSNGLRFDNSEPVQVGPGGHTVFLGDRIGVYHPDVTAPGVDISSTCDTSGVAVGPCPPGENTEASGTSMAAPHVAGAVAVLLQANPALTTTQVRQALQGTATPVWGTDENDQPTTESLPFWQIGYGYVDLNAAVKLVRRADWKTRIANLQAADDARVLAADGYVVKRSDLWTYDAPHVVIAGSDTQRFVVNVPRKVTDLKVTVSYPSLAVLGLNGTSYTAVVRDAAGMEIGASTQKLTDGAGTASAFIDLRSVTGITYGDFIVELTGDYAASDPDTLDSESLLGRMVTVQVAQIARSN